MGQFIYGDFTHGIILYITCFMYWCSLVIIIIWVESNISRHHEEWKDSSENGKKIFANHISEKGLIPKI
jgi:hypothetical protein